MKGKYIIYASLIWIVMIGISVTGNIRQDKENHRKTIHESAQTFFRQIVITRSWNARHGGVYVPVTRETQPNPYLKDKQRDLVTVSGLKLTKINPAYMTRQIAEIAESEKGIKFHITSLNPIRPANRAAQWETAALKTFEEGISEYGKFIKAGKSLSYRYMAPLFVKESCLKCHARQGYKLGDIRGGISVTIPDITPPLHMDMILSHLLFAAGGVFLIVFFGIRIHRYQENLVQARIEAESASRTKSSFLANLSHEIRTPINAIIGFSDILLKDTGNKEQQNGLSIIKTNGSSLLEILNDILDFSGIESGKINLDYGPVNLKKMFREIEDIFSLETSKKNLEFIAEIDPEFPTHLLLDRIKIKQVLINLVGNAVKFTHTGSVRLSAKCNFHENRTNILDLLFSLEDTGIGIAEDEWESIFEPFTQQKGQLQQEYGGTGLGLSISRKIIRAMGGDITVTSRKGAGSTFTVTLEEIEIVTLSDPSDETGETGSSARGIENKSSRRDDEQDQAAKEMNRENGTTGETPEKEETGLAAELLERLEGELFSVWLSLKKGIMVKQGLSLSREMIQLGLNYNNKPVTEWGEELEQQLKALDFHSARKTIEKYPGLIRSLKGEAAKTS